MSSPSPRSLPIAAEPVLHGQTVVVIGGSSGIGLAVAGLARQAGAELVLVGRHAERLQAAAASLGGAGQVIADLSAADTVPGIFRGLSRIDHLVITAGTAQLLPLQDATAEALRQVLEERLVGPLLAIQAARSLLVPGGSITLTSGLLASRPIAAGAAVLAGAVAAVEAIARALALELAPLRVNAIAPGLVDTPLLDQLFGSAKAQTIEGAARSLPVARIGRAEDIARAMFALMTNPYITGETLYIDGGGRWG